MSKNRTAVSDEAIISAILARGSIRKAALSLSVSPRMIYDRWGSPAFQVALRAAETAILRETVASIRGHLISAVENVAEIMNDKENVNAAVRLSACRTLIDSACKLSTVLIEQDKAVGDESGDVPWQSKYIAEMVDDWGNVENDG